MEINSKEIIQDSKQLLCNTIKLLDSVEIADFQVLDLSSSEYITVEDFELSIEIIKNQFPIIYTIELLNKKKVLLESFNTFSKINKSKTNNMNRLNHSRYNGGNSNVLYVGSSTTSFKSRLKDHP